MPNCFTYENGFEYLNELQDYYDLDTDFEYDFDNLTEQQHQDLSFLTEPIYSYFIEKLSVRPCSFFTLDTPCYANGIKCVVQLYVNKVPSTFNRNKIGAIFTYSNIYMSNKLLQHVSIEEIDFEDRIRFKNLIFNLLFQVFMVTNTFVYNPMLYYMYQGQDSGYLADVRLRSIRLFSVINECCVCYEPTIYNTICKHYLCYTCYDKMKKKECPLCKNNLTNNTQTLLFTSDITISDESVML